MSIEITFRVLTGYYDHLPNLPEHLYEQELEANPKLYFPILRQELTQCSLHTTLIIKYPEQPIVEISDVYEPLMRFCFYGIPNLITEKNTAYAFHSYSGFCTFEDQSGMVYYKGVDEVTAVLPREQLLPALYHCGQRMMDLYWRFLELKNKSREQVMAGEIELAQQAETLLKQAGYLPG